MTYSEVKITFNEDLQIGSRLLLAVGDSTAFLGIIIFERWVYYRTNSNQVTIGSPTNIIGERAAINFLSAFNLDYNSTGIYVTQRVQNEVTTSR